MNQQADDLRPRTDLRAARQHEDETDLQAQIAAAPLDIVWLGIVLAAACYPIVLGGIALIVLAFPYDFERVSFDFVATGFWVSAVSFVVGLVYGVAMSIPAFFVTQFVRWSLKGIISERGVSGIYGGMTGFLCSTGGGLFFANWMPGMRTWQEWLALVLASILAVMMGYIGAIWMGYRRRQEAFPFFEPIFSGQKHLTIGYLMKLTFVVAVFAGAFKAAGPAGFYIGIAWLVYFFTQALLLACDHWITLWWRGRTS